MGLLDLFSDSNEKAAMVDQKTALKKAQTSATGALTSGLNNATQSYTDALGYYSPYSQTGIQASGLYSDALGLNGATGAANAQSAYTASPGYQYATDQAIQALERRAGARGELAGGQTGLDTINAVYGLANQDYGSWLDRLYGQQGVGLNVAGAQAGIKTGLGNKQYGYGQDVANINWNTETGIGNAKAGYQTGKDQSGANIFGAITGGLSMGAKLLGIGG